MAAAALHREIYRRLTEGQISLVFAVAAIIVFAFMAKHVP
jgi:hypothetical protein